jgi:hypothetical protein
MGATGALDSRVLLISGSGLAQPGTLETCRCKRQGDLAVTPHGPTDQRFGAWPSTSSNKLHTTIWSRLDSFLLYLIRLFGYQNNAWPSAVMPPSRLQPSNFIFRAYNHQTIFDICLSSLVNAVHPIASRTFWRMWYSAHVIFQLPLLPVSL